MWVPSWPFEWMRRSRKVPGEINMDGKIAGSSTLGSPSSCSGFDREVRFDPWNSTPFETPELELGDPRVGHSKRFANPARFAVLDKKSPSWGIGGPRSRHSKRFVTPSRFDVLENERHAIRSRSTHASTPGLRSPMFGSLTAEAKRRLVSIRTVRFVRSDCR